MPSIHLLETRNKMRMDGTYVEDLKGAQAWKGLKSKGMERAPADVAECCHALRFCLISKLDGTRLNLQDDRCLPFEQGLTQGVARNTLETIFLYKNGIGVEGIKCIAKAMASLPRLKQINLYQNRLGDEGSAFLCRQLSLGVCAATLHTLWLSANNIHTFPEDLLKIKGLTRLFLNQNKITEIPKELAQLEKLSAADFDDNPIQGLPEFVFFRGMTKLPGPRWDLLRPHFEKELQLVGDQPDDD